MAVDAGRPVFAWSALLHVGRFPILESFPYPIFAQRPKFVRYGAQAERRNFFAMLGTLTASLSAQVMLAMWIPQWFVSPCIA